MLFSFRLRAALPPPAAAAMLIFRFRLIFAIFFRYVIDAAMLPLFDAECCVAFAPMPLPPSPRCCLPPPLIFRLPMPARRRCLLPLRRVTR